MLVTGANIFFALHRRELEARLVLGEGFLDNRLEVVVAPLIEAIMFEDIAHPNPDRATAVVEVVHSQSNFVRVVPQDSDKVFRQW